MSTNKSLEKRVKKLEKKQRRDKKEPHEICVARGPTAIRNTGTLVEMTYCPTTDRAGDMIFVTRLNNRFHIIHPKNTTYDATTVRLMVVRSKAGVLTAGVMPPNVYACPNYDLYYVLQDRIVELSAATWDGTSYAGFVAQTLNFKKRYKNPQTIQYDGASGSVGNGIYFWIIADIDSTAFFEGYNALHYLDN